MSAQVRLGAVRTDAGEGLAQVDPADGPVQARDIGKQVVDPEYPEERQAYMLEDSGVELLLSQSHLKLPLAQGVQRIDLDRGAPWFEDYSEANPDIHLDGENLAYVIYTSGSTGKPKGAGNRLPAPLGLPVEPEV